MDERQRWEHRVRTRLTTIKLALQMLKRRPELCKASGGPAERALDATNKLVAEFMRKR